MVVSTSAPWAPTQSVDAAMTTGTSAEKSKSAREDAFVTANAADQDLPVVRAATECDVVKVAALFQRCMPDTVWAKLGADACEVYFRHHVESARELLVVAETAGDVVGACLGTGRPGTWQRALYLEEAHRLAIALLRGISRQPLAIVPLGKRLALGANRFLDRNRRAAPPKGSSPRMDDSYMSLFFVAPEWRGHQLGSRMLATFSDEMAQRGYRRCTVRTTVANVRSQRAQQRAGFSEVARDEQEITFALALAAPEQRSEPLAVRVVSTVEELQRLAGRWERCRQVTRGASGFCAASFVRGLLIATPSRLPHVLVAERDDTVVGILPLALHGRVARSVGAGLVNYMGAVHLPEWGDACARAWLTHLENDRQIRTVDLHGLRDSSALLQALLRHHDVAVACTNVCPELDLRPGLARIRSRHKTKQRAAWARKHKRLSELGCVHFEETDDPARVLALLPHLFALFDGRWTTRRIRGGFAENQREFHRTVIRHLERGVIRLSLLLLDDDVIAFSYGLQGDGGTTSYVLAHDDRFRACSPGLLLLLQVLEAAIDRGDTHYDFSLGRAPYKDSWADREGRVYRVVIGAHRHRLKAQSRAWGALRNLPRLRRLKVEGVSALWRDRPAVPVLADKPGIQAGPEGRWLVQQVPHRVRPANLQMRPFRHAEHGHGLSPRALELAVERNFRGDTAFIVEREGRLLGCVWRARESRRQLISGGARASGDIWYHPIAAQPEDLRMVADSVSTEGSLLVSTSPIYPVHDEFAADFSFRVQPERSS